MVVNCAFWREQSERFPSLRQAALRERALPLGASYHPEGWGFDEVLGFRGRSANRWLLEHGTPAIVEEFKCVAGICAVALGAANTTDAWVEWVDSLRRERVSLEAAELQISSWEREPRPKANFEITAPGLLTVALEVRPDPDSKIVQTEILEINDVCGASGWVCRRLADEALMSELANPPSAPLRTTGADGSKTMTLKEAAKALRVSNDTLDRMRRRHEIMMFKVGSRWRVLASEVIRLRQQPRSDNR
jgi:excisionase family DNA binding protein